MMGRNMAIGLATMLAAGCATADVAPVRVDGATGRTVIFEDNFDNGALDRSKWNAIGPDFWVNNEQQAYFDSPETILFEDGMDGADGGVLVLKPVWKPGMDTNAEREADFISGRLNTRDNFDFTHGRAEARIRMPDNVGAWPAFWLLGNGAWPYTGEIDIMEYVGDKSWTAVAIHGPGYSGDTPIVKRRTFPAGQDVTGWHTYGVEWTGDSIAFDVDGDVFYTVSRKDIEQYGEWRFDTPKFLILNFAVGGVYPQKVFNIEEPYFGLPQDTVDAIKRGEVQMEVDWVRVYALE
ncbi:glycoside hydrolase family 16 protein [Pseudoblastomonas halimionae]|uniref:Family 16 glycosylhydrolase n=1 Tax=Alteriqipengyuania halimionae TaxID=1926630 RepID=A0A6I4U114_9SPHN|nr:glycoside hydrolase family 16 protein [Alteriqipengyuania halimionae]MXP08625.1 family 16 glycosylhydrolase [Alteriqipengyuania halimionae]